ncbi:MAG: S24 family peptidase [Methylobacter sp.]
MVTIDEKQNFSYRLNKVLDRAGIPPKGKGRQGAVAQIFGVSQKGARKWLEGEAIPESSKIPQFIEKFRSLKITGEWLFHGNPAYAPEWLTSDTSTRHLQIEESNAEYAHRLGDHRLVPVVGTAQLGDNGHWYELGYPVGHGDGAIDYPTRDRNAYALRCVGDSMKPRIKDGEFVIVEPNSEPIPGDEVLLRSVDGRVMVKTFLYIRDNRVHLMSINEAHPPQSFALEEVDKIHYISAIVKKALWVKDHA